MVSGARQVFTWGQAVLNGFANDQHTPGQCERAAPCPQRAPEICISGIRGRNLLWSGEYLPALLYNSSLLSASPTHSCVVDRDNNLRSIGANTHGELGSGTEKKSSLLTAKLPCQVRPLPATATHLCPWPARAGCGGRQRLLRRGQQRTFES